MQIAVLNDTHFGARNDNQQFLDYFFRFFDDVFFPYCEEHNIKTVIHLGDIMDRRKYVNFNTLNQVRTRFVQKLAENGMVMHCIPGNHDTFYKNTNSINCLNELFDHYDNIKVYEEPTTLDFDGVTVDLIPWINAENHARCMEFIQNSKSLICGGHFELDGFQVLRGVLHHGGMDPSVLSDYNLVMSGHFHNGHKKGNVHYLGTQYQITFSDLNDQKGFHILNTEDLSVEQIKNPDRLFVKIAYDDSDPTAIESIDLSHFEGKYVRLYVNNKQDPSLYERFLDGLYEAKAVNVVVFDDVVEKEYENEIDLSVDTMTLINQEIDDSVPETIDKDRLKAVVRELYLESLSK